MKHAGIAFNAALHPITFLGHE